MKAPYNPFPCSHCDGIFLSWGGLFMHKQRLEAEESISKYVKNEFISEEQRKKESAQLIKGIEDIASSFQKKIEAQKKFDDRAKKLLRLIETKIGPSSNEKYPFDFPKLEKQALTYLKLEEELTKTKKGSEQHNPCQYRIIIAACCYVQFKQQQVVVIKAKDLTKAYKKLMIQPDKALDFIRKCDNLHKNKVKAERALSGATTIDNDASYDLIRIDQIDEISPSG